MKFKLNFNEYALISFILFSLAVHVFTVEIKKKTGKKDPLTDLSDAELDKLMKDYGLSSKDLGILGNNSTKPEANKKKYDLLDLNDEEDPLQNLLKTKNKKDKAILNSPSAIFNYNKNILRKFHISQRNAYNLLNTMKNLDIFYRLPITARNIIAVIRPFT
jgi:hypothetical protein